MSAPIGPNGFDLAALLQSTVDEAASLLPANAAAMYLVASSGELCWTCDSIAANEGLRGMIRGDASDQAVVGRALARRETVAEGGIVGLPMLSQDGVALGVLALFDRGERVLSPRDLALAEAVARHAAFEIEAARLIERLHQADALHRYLLDRLPDGVWAADEHGIFSYLSEGSERLLGYEPDELVGKSSQLVMHESTREAFEEGYRWQVAHPDGEQTYRVNLRHKDGHAVPVELHNIGTPRTDGTYGGGQGSVREMTERDRLEREIRAQAAELAASRERTHLAQELHDSVTQALFSMTITAGAAAMLLERGAPGVDAKLDELSALARDALAEMRSLIFELRPGSLADEGFIPALRKHVAAVQGRTGLAIRLTVDPELPRLSLGVEDALYRIAQEALHNIVKHARAHEVRIDVAHESGGVRMDIRDDGVGFDPRSRTEGLGLAGITARMERLGGTASVTSRPGGGTVVSVRVPVEVSR
jgi:PAS domain S-box-containing protein